MSKTLITLLSISIKTGRGQGTIKDSKY